MNQGSGKDLGSLENDQGFCEILKKPNYLNNC